MTDGITKPTLEIAVGEDKFVVRVPNPLDRARLGTREAAIRRSIDPSSNGWPDGLDADTFYLIRGMAVLELLLDQSTAKWAYAETDEGVKVDINKFPPGKETVITEVGRRFQTALDEFHGRGNKADAVSGEAVAGSQQSPEAL